MRRIRIEIVSLLATIGAGHIIFWLTDNTASLLIPLPEWRPLVSMLLAIPLGVAIVVRLVQPVRRAALTRPRSEAVDA